MKSIAPHEPREQLHSVDEAFADARDSEARWQAYEAESDLKRIVIELPEPVYHSLERLAQRQQRSVSVFVEHVIQELLSTFSPSA
jgi:hypothetical protein